MLGRRYSKDRSYRLDVDCNLKSISLYFELDSNDEECLDVLRDIESMARTYGIFFDVRAEGERISAELFPFYADVGLAGVKDGDRDKTYSEWLEYHFDGME